MGGWGWGRLMCTHIDLKHQHILCKLHVNLQKTYGRTCPRWRGGAGRDGMRAHVPDVVLCCVGGWVGGLGVKADLRDLFNQGILVFNFRHEMDHPLSTVAPVI